MIGFGSLIILTKQHPIKNISITFIHQRKYFIQVSKTNLRSFVWFGLKKKAQLKYGNSFHLLEAGISVHIPIKGLSHVAFLKFVKVCGARPFAAFTAVPFLSLASPSAFSSASGSSTRARAEVVLTEIAHVAGCRWKLLCSENVAPFLTTGPCPPRSPCAPGPACSAVLVCARALQLLWVTFLWLPCRNLVKRTLKKWYFL